MLAERADFAGSNPLLSIACDGPKALSPTLNDERHFLRDKACPPAQPPKQLGFPTAHVVDQLVAPIETLSNIPRPGESGPYDVRMKGPEQTPATRRLLSSSAEICPSQSPCGLSSASIWQKREPEPAVSVHEKNATDLCLVALLSATRPIVKAPTFVPENDIGLAVHRSPGEAPAHG
jgi:hypothetical protein